MSNSNFSNNTTDEELIQLIKIDNNNVALSSLLQKYRPIIFSKIRAFNFNECDIDDIYQECIIALYSIIFDYNPEKSSFRTFSDICINRILFSIMRSKYSKRRIPQDFLVDFDESDFIADTNSPELIFERYNNYELLLHKVSEHLSKLELQVLFKLVAGLSYAEISDELDITLKSVDNAVQRIRKKFSNL